MLSRSIMILVAAGLLLAAASYGFSEASAQVGEPDQCWHEEDYDYEERTQSLLSSQAAAIAWLQEASALELERALVWTEPGDPYPGYYSEVATARAAAAASLVPAPELGEGLWTALAAGEIVGSTTVQPHLEGWVVTSNRFLLPSSVCMQLAALD